MGVISPGKTGKHSKSSCSKYQWSGKTHAAEACSVCVCVCFMSNKINRIQDPEYSISSFHRTGNMSASVCDIRASTQTRPITRSYFYSAVPPRAPADVRRKLFMSVSSSMNKLQDDRLKRYKTKHRRVHALQHAKQLWINEWKTYNETMCLW